MPKNTKKIGLSIYETTNYGLFKFIPSNRPIEEHHVKYVMAEIQANKPSIWKRIFGG